MQADQTSVGSAQRRWVLLAIASMICLAAIYVLAVLTTTADAVVDHITAKWRRTSDTLGADAVAIFLGAVAALLLRHGILHRERPGFGGYATSMR